MEPKKNRKVMTTENEKPSCSEETADVVRNVAVVYAHIIPDQSGGRMTKHVSHFIYKNTTPTEKS